MSRNQNGATKTGRPKTVSCAEDFLLAFVPSLSWQSVGVSFENEIIQKENAAVKFAPELRPKRGSLAMLMLGP